MPSLNFLDEFVPAVENGLDLLDGRPLRHPGVMPKLQTFRPMRKRPFVEGDTLHLFEKPYRPEMRKLGMPICTSARPHDFDRFGRLSRDGVGIMPDEFNRIAVADGFEDIHAMIEWVDGAFGLPVHGQLIKWDKPEGVA